MAILRTVPAVTQKDNQKAKLFVSPSSFRIEECTSCVPIGTSWSPEAIRYPLNTIPFGVARSPPIRTTITTAIGKVTSPGKARFLKPNVFTLFVGWKTPRLPYFKARMFTSLNPF